MLASLNCVFNLSKTNFWARRKVCLNFFNQSIEDRITWLKNNLFFGDLIKAILIVQIFVWSDLILDMAIHIVELLQNQSFLPLTSKRHLWFLFKIEFWYQLMLILFIFKNIDDCPWAMTLFLRVFRRTVTWTSAFFTGPASAYTSFLIFELLSFRLTPFDFNLYWWVCLLDNLLILSRFYWLLRGFDLNLRMPALNAFISVSSFPGITWIVFFPISLPHRLYCDWCTFTPLAILLHFQSIYHFVIFLIFHNLGLTLSLFWRIRPCHLFFFLDHKVWFVSLIVCLFC